MNKITKSILSLITLVFLAGMVNSTEILNQRTFPANASDRFWVSGTGTSSVTITDADTLTGANVWRSETFDLWFKEDVNGEDKWFMANRLYWFGEIVGSGDDQSFADSLVAGLIMYTPSGDSGFTVNDTVIMDTSWVSDWTAGSRQFFMVEIDMHDHDGSDINTRRGALFIKSIEKVADDTSLTDDCGVIIQRTD